MRGGGFVRLDQLACICLGVAAASCDDWWDDPPQPGSVTAIYRRTIGPADVSGVVFDSSGHAIVSGTIRGAFDPSLGITDVPASSSMSSGFVAEFQVDGRLAWLHRWSNDGGSAAGTVTVDRDDNVLVAGWSSGNVDVGGGGAVAVADPMNTFLVKYAGSGEFVSSRLLPGEFLAEDEQQNVTAVEWATDSTSLVKVDAQGVPLWSKTIAQGRAVVTAGPNGILAAGQLDIGSATPPPPPPGVPPEMAFGVVASFGTDGQIAWSHTLHTLQWGGLGLVAYPDASGGAWVGGNFDQQLLTGGDQPLSAPSDCKAAFVAKYDASGNHLFSKSYGTTPRAENAVVSIATNARGEVYLTGEFAGAIDFGSGTMWTRGLGDHDVFLARLAPDGTSLSSAQFGGAGYRARLATGPGGQIAVVGVFDEGPGVIVFRE
jgi:hypothetical protein